MLRFLLTFDGVPVSAVDKSAVAALFSAEVFDCDFLIIVAVAVGGSVRLLADPFLLKSTDRDRLEDRMSDPLYAVDLSL